VGKSGNETLSSLPGETAEVKGNRRGDLDKRREILMMNMNASVVEINRELCFGCGLCANVCPAGAISLSLGKAQVNPLACTGCGHCLNVCRTGAIRWREFPRRAPQEPFGRDGWPRKHRFVRAQQVFREPTRRTSDLGELKDRIRDLQEKADDIVKRIDRL
jgi:ferredoxin